MFLINLHAVPTKQTEYFDELAGAYVSAYIDYKDEEGAVYLAKFYVEEEGWVVNNIEEDCFVINSHEDLDEEQKELFDEAKQYGFTLVFNGYEAEEVE